VASNLECISLLNCAISSLGAFSLSAASALVKRFVAREDALELVELAGGVPIVGPLARRFGNAVVARLFPA